MSIDQQANFLLIEADRELRQLSKSTGRQIVNVLVHSFPRLILPISNYFDEVFLALTVAVDVAFSLKHSSTFSEHFYSLTRHSQPSSPSPSPSTTTGSVIFSVIVGAVVEYISTHDTPPSESTTAPTSTPPSTSSTLPQSTLNSRLNFIFKFIHKLIGPMAAVDIIYKTAYLLGQTHYTSLVNHLFRVRIMQDGSKSTASRSGILAFIVLSLKLLQFYYSRPKTTNIISIPPPPRNLKQTHDDGICPQCNQSIENPVTDMKGIVYCFTCISPDVKYIKLN